MITVQESLTCSAHGFVVEIDPVSGNWNSLTLDGVPILRNRGPDFSLSLASEIQSEKYLVASQETAGLQSQRLTLRYRLGWDGGRALEAEQVLELSPGRVERSLRVRRGEFGGGERLLAATLFAGGFLEDHIEETMLSMPMTRSLPALPLAAILDSDVPGQGDQNGNVFAEEGLDKSLATIMLNCEALGLHIAILPLPDQCPVKARLAAAEDGVRLEQEFACEMRLKAGPFLQVARQVYLFTRETWQEAARTVGKYWPAQSYQPPADRPGWAKEAIILEADLTFFGGLQKLTTRLHEIREQGFNTIYLLPWHSGHWDGYGTFRYDEMNPAHGSLIHLREFCDEAHRHGLRVLFDLLVNVAGENSPYPHEHPEWFYRDPQGKILKHPTWNSWCFDPASPGFRKFLTDYAVRCCSEWGADGFRVDAAAYRGGNWNNLPGLQPHQHSHAIFTLLGEIRDAIQVENPEAICMAECFGPTQVPISDLVAYQWVAWLDWVNAGLLSGQITGAALGRMLGEHFLAMPRGTWLVGYTHTHDTIAFEKRELDGPAIATLFSLLTLICSGSMVFGGGWKMRERPGSGEQEAMRDLFRAKKALGGISSHELTFVENTNPALLVVERPSRMGRITVISNFSSKPQLIPGYGRPFYSRNEGQVGEIAPFDTIIVPF